MILKIFATLDTPPTDVKQNGDEVLTLPFEIRQKSRFKANLDSGKEVGIFLERGKILRHGELLQAENGLVIKLAAAKEQLSTVTCQEPLLLAKLCYHLGNRHVSLQIEAQQIRYLKDTVLDEMIIGLGGQVQHQLLPFEPEEGAYSSHRN